jgi:hypothetical protein
VTPQEEQLLQSLAERVNSTQLQEKDPDAEAFLNQSFNSNPDAIYILAQTVLVQNIALEQAKAQVAQLQQQVQQARQPAHATSFLGSLLGHHDPQPVPQPAPAYAQSEPPFQPVQPQYLPPAQPQFAQPQYVPMAGAQPSFLRGAVQTAAGVAAGALAFEGVEAALHGIMGHPGYGGYGWGGPGMGMGGFGMGGPGMGVGFERPVEETVVNNYYDQPGGAPEHHEQLNQGGLDQGSGEQHFHESANQNAGQDFDRGGAQFSDASYNTQGDDRGSVNDSNFDNANVDNSGADDSAQDLGQDDNSGFEDSSFQDSGSDSGGLDDGGGGFDSGGDNSFV